VNFRRYDSEKQDELMQNLIEKAKKGDESSKIVLKAFGDLCTSYFILDFK